MENMVRESVDNYQQQGADVGLLLRKTREGYGKTLSDVERTLRIRECQIAAIEAGDVAKLPGRVYAIGFVRTYAEYLGLDGGDIVRLFKAQYMDAQPSQLLEFAIPASDTKTPSLWFATILAVFLLGGVFYYTSLHQANRDIVTGIPAPPSEQQAVVTEAPKIQNNVQTVSGQSQNMNLNDVSTEAGNEGAVVAGAEDASTSSAIPKEKDAPEPATTSKNGIILKLIENSWVEIKDAQGKVIVSNVLKVGDQYFVPDNPGLTMSLGNAGGVQIVMNGRIMKPLGKTGDIRRDIPLDTDYLKTLEFKEEPPKSETSAEPVVPPTVAPDVSDEVEDVKPD